MGADPPASWPPAPASLLDPSGRPRLGAYVGSIERIDLSPLAGRGLSGAWRRLTSLKRWHFAFLASEEVVAGMAVIHLGYAAGGFVWAHARESGEILLDRTWLAPAPAVYLNDRPGPGARASLDLPGATLRVERRSDRYELLADLGPDGRLEAALDTAAAPPPFTLVAPARRGAHVTQKAGALATSGELRAGARRFTLDGGLGGLDYTQGLLRHRTRWRWAFGAGRGADGRPVAFNLVSGLHAGGAREDVLFLGAGVRPLPAVSFRLDRRRTLAPWGLASADGALRLGFEPLGEHREERALGPVRARLVQVAGTFHGTLPAPGGALRIAGVPGVCEDQDAWW